MALAYTARGHTAGSLHIRSPPLSSLLSSHLALTSNPPRHSQFFVRVLLEKLHFAKMGAIPEYDPEEPLETKPFKFVTGKCTHSPLPRKRAQIAFRKSSTAN
ncbi:hypothetical protein VI817_004707 [Penicillium citrinum]|nr:hypothetical protein VI817_004707 [Penicillium citrinum]